MTTSPLSASSILHSSDARIKTNIAEVDTSVILQRISSVKLHSYVFTKEWSDVRGDLPPGSRVRGVIAQELGHKFPEHVKVIPELRLDDKKFTMQDFHQVDNTGLLMDLVSAVQSHSERFTVGANSAKPWDATGFGGILDASN